MAKQVPLKEEGATLGAGIRAPAPLRQTGPADQEVTPTVLLALELILIMDRKFSK